MSGKWIAEKEKIMLQINREMLIQLAAVSAEDVSRFLRSVEACDQLIVEMDQLEQQTPSLSWEQKEKLQTIGQNILHLRTQISEHLPAWREKLRINMLREQANVKFKHAYEDKEDHIPPIFLDKKK